MPGNENLSTSASDYQEFPPPLLLAGHLVCFWTQSIDSRSGGYQQRVVPDGCVDIVVSNHNKPVVIGPWTESFIAHLAPAEMLVGARWRPGRAPALLGLPASELLNQFVPLCDIWGRTADEQFAGVAHGPSLRARLSSM